jgi:hypothetical protein
VVYPITNGCAGIAGCSCYIYIFFFLRGGGVNRTRILTANGNS